MNTGNQFTVRRFWDPYPQSCGKIMFLHLSVSRSVHRDRGSLYDVNFLSGYLVPCSFQGVSVSGPMSLVFVQGVSLTETPQTETPLYGKERAARILLECILVSSNLRRIHEDSNRKNSNVYLSKACKLIFEVQHAYNSNLSFDTFQ